MRYIQLQLCNNRRQRYGCLWGSNRQDTVGKMCPKQNIFAFAPFCQWFRKSPTILTIGAIKQQQFSRKNLENTQPQKRHSQKMMQIPDSNKPFGEWSNSALRQGELVSLWVGTGLICPKNCCKLIVRVLSHIQDTEHPVPQNVYVNNRERKVKQLQR